MPNIVHLQTNFTAGEISPRLLGRSDLSKYNNGARTIENAVVQTHGGLTRRTGTRFAAEVKSSSLVPRLVEFHYNSEQSYVLEIGVTSGSGNNGLHASPGTTGYIRFFRLDSNNLPYRIDEDGDGTGTITEITGKPWVSSELSTLRFTQSADTMYIFCPTRPIMKLTRTGEDIDPDNWVLTQLDGATNGFVDGPYLDMNTTDVAFAANTTDDGTGCLVTAYDDDSDGGQKFYFAATDIGRVIRLEDPAKGYHITRVTPGSPAGGQNELYAIPATVKIATTEMAEATTAGSSCKVEFFDVTRGPVVLDGTLHEARGIEDLVAQTQFKLYNANTAAAEPYDQFPATGFEGTQITGKCRIVPAKHSGWGVITAISGSASGGLYKKVEVHVLKSFVSTERTKNWRLGAWSKTTQYPENGTFHQNRLWCATTKTQPQTLWASETNVYNTFSPNSLETGQVVDSSPLTLTLASRQVNAIHHMKSDSQGIVVFTSGGEWLGRATNPSSPITPTDVSFVKQSAYGSLSGAEPIRLGTSYLLFQRDAVTMREFTYEFGQDRFVAPNITIMSEHITRNKVSDVTFQLGPTPRLWCVTEAGELLTLTYDKVQEVVAWSKHKMAVSGTGGSANTVATVTSCARTTDSNEDNIWLLIKRKIGTADKYFVEMLTQDFEASTEHKDAFFLDRGISNLTDIDSAIITGLDHLNGEKVFALADSVYYANSDGNGYTVGSVSGGIGITLPSAVTDATVGLRYKTIVESLPLNVDQSLNAKGKRKRIFTSFLNMYRSISGKFGTPEQVYDIEYSAATSSPPELRTALVEILVPDNSDREMIVRFEQEDAHPANLLGITSEISLGV